MTFIDKLKKVNESLKHTSYKTDGLCLVETTPSGTTRYPFKTLPELEQSLEAYFS